MKVILGVALALGATSAVADDALPRDISGSYLCKATASAGIRFDETSKQWKSAKFNVEGDSLLVKVKFTGQTGKFDFLDSAYRVYEVRVKQFGQPGEGNYCAEAGGEPQVRVSGTAIRCTQVFYDYWFNFETNKFQYAFDGGYMHTNMNTDTPAITVGVCDKVD